MNRRERRRAAALNRGRRTGYTHRVLAGGGLDWSPASAGCSWPPSSTTAPAASTAAAPAIACPTSAWAARMASPSAPAIV